MSRLAAKQGEEGSLQSRPWDGCERAETLLHAPEIRTHLVLLQDLDQRLSHRPEDVHVVMRVDVRRRPAHEIDETSELGLQFRLNFIAIELSQQDSFEESREREKPPALID